MKQITEPPCPRCLKLAQEGHIRVETVQHIPPGVGRAPLGLDGIKCCYDCASADTLTRLNKSFTFQMARVAVGNDRQEQYRLPGLPAGLVKEGIMRPSEPGDFQRQLDWLDRQNWFGLRNEELP